MLVQTTPAALAAYAKAPSCRVLQQDHQAHIVAHLEQRTTAYALFETDWIIPHGRLRSTDTPVLAMVKEADDGLRLSLADPDLRLPKRRNMGYLDDEANRTPARPSLVQVELRGRWRLAEDSATVRRLAVAPDATRLAFTCRDGGTVEVRLVPEPASG
jgi:chondroitin-sulfate-ABC endolyase/exolyase